MTHLSHILLWLPVAMIIGFVAAWLESSPSRSAPPKLEAAYSGVPFLERQVAWLLEDRRLLWGQVHVLRHQVGRLRRERDLVSRPANSLASAQLATAEAAQ